MNNYKYLLLFLTGFFASMNISAADLDIVKGKWNIVFNDNKTLTCKYNGVIVLDGVYMRVGNKPTPATLNDALTSKDCSEVALKSEVVNDAFGSGTKYTYVYKSSGKNTLEQDIFVYDSHPYILIQGSVVSAADVTYNYVAPIVSETNTTVLPSSGDNRVFDMPFDNDSWHTFSALKWANVTTGNTSMEATAFYDVKSRQGLVIGTVDHDTWKTGAYVKTATTSGVIKELQIYGGYVGRRTWDVIDGDSPSLTRHGAVTGKRVSSARVFVGTFDDWRIGLEEYGKANAIVAPKRKWEGGTIFGWQSWGGMAQYVNYQGSLEVSEYFKSNLPHVKNEQGTTYLILDSYWDNMSDHQLGAFVRRCEKNGQIPGIYDTPYTFWGDANQVDTWSTGVDGVNYGEIVLRAGGKPRKINGVSLDPTHPITKKLVKNKVERLKNLGFKYIKIDFLNNAALEADSYYDKNITTGMQAYNEGLRYYAECCGEDIFINLSIAPVWPAHYAQGRRIGCDAWGSKEQSQYTLNCMNLSWWLENVYSFNDPDHIVYMDKSDTGKGFNYWAWTENLNRMRTTTGVMCGTLVLGDNFSLNNGTCKGIQAARDRAEKLTNNPDIIAVARIGKMFRPVEGSLNNAFSLWGANDYCDNTFILEADDAYYVAVFNFGTSALTSKLDFSRLGVDGDNVKEIKELWRSTATSFTATGFNVNVPREDACIYKISKTKATGIEIVEADNAKMNVCVADGFVMVDAPKGISCINVYGIDGRLLHKASFSGNSRKESMRLDVDNCVYIVNVTLNTGDSLSQKVALS